MAQILIDKVWTTLKTPETELAYDPAISPPSIYPTELKAGSQKFLYTHVHNSPRHNSQEVEEKLKCALMRNKQNVAFRYNELLSIFILKQEILSLTTR